jgi:histidinol-phosphate aminotransferase
LNRYQRPNIAAMQGYTWGEQPEDSQTIKLNTNENPYPPSPAVAQTLASLDINKLRTYPQPTADPLRDEIAQQHGLERNNVVVTNGGDEALRLAMTTYVQPGAGFGMAQPSYSLYPVLAHIHDAKVVTVPLEDDWQYPSDFATQINDAGVQLTCVVNPHAPSGILTHIDQLATLAADLNGVLLIDEAYVNFIDPDLAYRSEPLLSTFDNVLILRTFSKGYSLAGLRLGYLLGCPTLIDPIVSKTRDSYNIDHLSQMLGLASFRDRQYAAQTWLDVRNERSRLDNNLRQLGLSTPPSQANFLLAQVPQTAPLSAEAIYLALKERHILVRYFNTPQLADKLRISIGTPEQNERLVTELTQLLT